MVNNNLILLVLTSLLSLIWISCEETGPVPAEPSEQVRNLDNLTVISGDTEPLYEIHFQEEQVFGEIYENAPYGPSPDLQSVVDDEGRVFIPDEGNRIINVFSTEGNIIDTVGREGRGPGEFVSLLSMGIELDELYVDGGLSRISYFSLDSLSLSHTLTLDPESWQNLGGDSTVFNRAPRKYFGINDTTLLGGFRVWYDPEDTFNYYLNFHLIHKNQHVNPNRILEVPSIQRYGLETNSDSPAGIFTLPISQKPLLAVNSDDRLHYAWSDDPLIRVLDMEGRYQRAFYLMIPKVRLHEEDLIEQSGYRSLLSNAMRGMDLPPAWPALSAMIIDNEDRIWVSTVVENFDIYQWWVLDEEGTVVARFDWPKEKPIENIIGGNIYTRETDDMGFERIVRYQYDLTSEDDTRE